MRTFDKRLAQGARLARVLVARAPTLTLDAGQRRKSRLAAMLDNGEAVGVLLPRGTVLSDGDVLVGQDGALARVVAAAQPVLIVRGADARALARAAYHLGNRHIPVEIGAEHLKLEDDPVLARMLRGLGLTVQEAALPFEPEAGAYGGGHRHGHDETFAEDHALARTLFDEHAGHTPCNPPR